MAKAMAALRAMLKPMREMALRRSREAPAVGIHGRGVGELQQPRGQRGLGAHDAHHVFDVDLLVGQRAAHARGDVRETRQVDLLAGELHVERFDQARQFRLARVGGTLRRRRQFDHVEAHKSGNVCD